MVSTNWAKTSVNSTDYTAGSVNSTNYTGPRVGTITVGDTTITLADTNINLMGFSITADPDTLPYTTDWS